MVYYMITLGKMFGLSNTRLPHTWNVIPLSENRHTSSGFLRSTQKESGHRNNVIRPQGGDTSRNPTSSHDMETYLSPRSGKLRIRSFGAPLRPWQPIIGKKENVPRNSFSSLTFLLSPPPPSFGFTYVSFYFERSPPRIPHSRSRLINRSRGTTTP